MLHIAMNNNEYIDSSMIREILDIYIYIYIVQLTSICTVFVGYKNILMCGNANPHPWREVPNKWLQQSGNKMICLYATTMDNLVCACMQIANYISWLKYDMTW